MKVLCMGSKEIVPPLLRVARPRARACAGLARFAAAAPRGAARAAPQPRRVCYCAPRTDPQTQTLHTLIEIPSTIYILNKLLSPKTVRRRAGRVSLAGGENSCASHHACHHATYPGSHSALSCPWTALALAALLIALSGFAISPRRRATAPSRRATRTCTRPTPRRRATLHRGRQRCARPRKSR